MSLADKIRAEHIDLRKPKPVLVLRPELLLCENVPKPMHCVAPRNVLGSVWWNQTRQVAYESTSFHCLACGVWKHNAEYRQWLEGHEYFSVDYKAGRMTYIETVPLCHLCHNAIHSGRLAALLEKGQISHVKFAAIIRHRDAILKAAGLTLAPEYNGPFAPWSSWRLVLFGKEYPPKYATREEWESAFKV